MKGSCSATQSTSAGNIRSRDKPRVPAEGFGRLHRQGGRRSERIRKCSPDFARIHLDDLALQRPKNREQLALFAGGHFEFLERPDEVVDQRVELTSGHLHPGVRFPHATSAVVTWSTGGLANLVDQHIPQAPKVGPRKLEVDPIVRGHSVAELFDDRCDRVETAESLVQRSFHDSPQTRGFTALPRQVDYSPSGQECQYARW